MRLENGDHWHIDVVKVVMVFVLEKVLDHGSDFLVHFQIYFQTQSNFISSKIRNFEAMYSENVNKYNTKTLEICVISDFQNQYLLFLPGLFVFLAETCIKISFLSEFQFTNSSKDFISLFTIECKFRRDELIHVGFLDNLSNRVWKENSWGANSLP